MLEIVLVLLTLGSLLAVAYGPWLLLLQVGTGLAALGMLVGAPAGLVYHLKLRACLVERGVLAPRWWVRPVSQHRLLDEGALAGLRSSFLVGAAGFLLAMLGCWVVVLSIVASFLRPLG